MFTKVILVFFTTGKIYHAIFFNLTIAKGLLLIRSNAGVLVRFMRFYVWFARFNSF